jgi:hypothetical protein
MGIIKENAPSGAKENPQNIARRKSGYFTWSRLSGRSIFL